ncbi:hypothetical protein [Catenuloplanes atrovinosus]|uniref:Uncharacterized protein n=1 Tax=Catenuloplanes atrovinosus TaxID=137266 RepID=A0AAE3YJU2_9ACTN|nr:hypothetical protein [Catenuloplanes atrovinosus]MDR7273483.1 hypothetical protein [Catenuloplanes atrovinosus]
MIDHDVRIEIDLFLPATDHALGAGDILRIAQTDYCYGNGPLTLRITRLGADPAAYPALEWLGLTGVELTPDGAEGDVRHVLVRADVIRGVRVPGPPRTG